VSRGRSNACNPLAPRIDKNLGNPMVKKVLVRTLADRRWIRLLSVNKPVSLSLTIRIKSTYIPKLTFRQYQTPTVGAPGRGTSCVTTPQTVLMALSDEKPVRDTVLRFGSLDFTFDGLVELSVGAPIDHTSILPLIPL
jgi:hypothetical protein